MEKSTTRSLINTLLLGSTLYGCGGGGDPKTARTLLQTIPPKEFPRLQRIRKFNQSDLFVTCFTVGGLQPSIINNSLLQTVASYLTIRLNRQVSGIMPVEIGPLSLAIAYKVASLLRIPVVDADFVGGRSTPEVFLETITLFNIKRTPMIVADSQGNLAVMEKSNSPQAEELFLRQFTQLSNSPALVMGYPVSPNLIYGKVVESTVSSALTAGVSIQSQTLARYLKQVNGKLLIQGQIDKIIEIDSPGFSTCRFIISTTKGTAEVFAKNENLIVFQNNEPIYSCPNLITFCTDKLIPLYNQHIKEGMSINVVGMKAPPIWRTPAALALFNPKLFGYQVKPILRSC